MALVAGTLTLGLDPDMPVLVLEPQPNVMHYVGVADLGHPRRWKPLANGMEERHVFGRVTSDGEQVDRGPLVWTDEGWTDVRRFVRYRADNKRRVQTPASLLIASDSTMVCTAAGAAALKDVSVGAFLTGPSLPEPQMSAWQTMTANVVAFFLNKTQEWQADLDAMAANDTSDLTSILNAPKSVRRAFMDAWRQHHDTGVTVQAALRAAMLAHIAASVGHRVSVAPAPNTHGSVRLTIYGRAAARPFFNTHVEPVTSAERVGVDGDGWLYSASTANGRLVAGVGGVVLCTGV